MDSVCKKKLKKLKWLWIITIIIGVLYIIPTPEEDVSEDTKTEEKKAVKEEKKEPNTVEGKLQEKIEDELGVYNNDKNKYVKEITNLHGVLTIKINPNVGINANNMISSMNSDTTKILELSKDIGGVDVVHIQMWGVVVSALGDNDMRPLLDVRLKKETLDKINFEGFMPENLPKIAESYGLDASLR